MTLTANPAAIPSGTTGAIGYVTIAGPANSVTRLVSLFRREAPALTTSAGLAPLTFWAKAGSANPDTRFISVSPIFPDTIRVATDDGGDWLTTPVRASSIILTVNPSGLGPGDYHGTVTVSSTAHSEYAAAQIAVSLTVLADTPPVVATPASLAFNVPSGSFSSSQILTLNTGNSPADFSVTAATADGNDWLVVQPGDPAILFGQLAVGAHAGNLPPAPTLAQSESPRRLAFPTMRLSASPSSTERRKPSVRWLPAKSSQSSA